MYFREYIFYDLRICSLVVVCVHFVYDMVTIFNGSSNISQALAMSSILALSGILADKPDLMLPQILREFVEFVIISIETLEFLMALIIGPDVLEILPIDGQFLATVFNATARFNLTDSEALVFRMVALSCLFLGSVCQAYIFKTLRALYRRMKPINPTITADYSPSAPMIPDDFYMDVDVDVPQTVIYVPVPN